MTFLCKYQKKYYSIELIKFYVLKFVSIFLMLKKHVADTKLGKDE